MALSTKSVGRLVQNLNELCSSLGIRSSRLSTFNKCVIAIPLLWVLFDVNYFARAIIHGIYSRCMFMLEGRTDVFKESVSLGVCLTTDLDVMMHKNNSRYLRECDFARFKLWIRTGIFSVVRKLGGTFTLGGSTIRYRKSINLFDVYYLKTVILGWDNKSFYLEHTFIRRRDGFIYAIIYIKQTLVRATPGDVMKELMGHAVDSPKLPEEVQLWIECNRISSEKLRKQEKTN